VEVVTSVLIAVSIPLLLYVVLIGVFAFVATFGSKHQKQAAKVLDMLVRVRMRGR
jgi:type III secretion system FlhB-like substrate exporter